MHRFGTAIALPLLLAAGLLLPAGPRAAATPSTGVFEDLLVEMNARDAALPASGLTKEQRKWKSALAKSFRALAYDSHDLSGDLKIGGRITRALEKGYPGDGTLGNLLQEACNDLRDLVVGGRDQLEVTAALLEDGAPRVKALARLAQADASLALAAEAATNSGRLKLIGRAHRFVLKGDAAAAKGSPGGPTGASTMTATVRGQPWAANSDFGTAVSGIATVSGASGGLRKLLVRGRRILPVGEPPLPGDESTIELSLTAVTGNLEPGTYTVGNSGGVSTGANWIEEVDGVYGNGIAVSGTVTLAEIDIKLGSVTVTGGFSLTIWDGGTGGTFQASSGVFEAFDLPRYTE